MSAVFLCGFMGCGKTKVGKLLAEALDEPFNDLDDYIVLKEGRSIPEIFMDSGEPYFRRAEAACIGELSENGGVIATGGGAMLNPETAALARSRGNVVFLDVPFNVCYERIQGDTNRPLVMSNTREQLEALYDRRKSVYAEHSTHTIPHRETPEERVALILALLRRGF